MKCKKHPKYQAKRKPTSRHKAGRNTHKEHHHESDGTGKILGTAVGAALGHPVAGFVIGALLDENEE